MFQNNIHTDEHKEMELNVVLEDDSENICSGCHRGGGAQTSQRSNLELFRTPLKSLLSPQKKSQWTVDWLGTTPTYSRIVLECLWTL